MASQVKIIILVSEYSLFMTDRKGQILKAALALFATEGFHGVSTNKIAKKAAVSEGLIFRHFENKKGLLEALLEHAFDRMGILLMPIISEEKPKKVLEKYILLPFEIDKSEYHFWKLLFKLKWEIEYSGAEKLKPLVDKLAWAFSELKFNEPEKEAEILVHIIESISVGILKDGKKSQAALKEFLLTKYLD